MLTSDVVIDLYARQIAINKRRGIGRRIIDNAAIYEAMNDHLSDGNEVLHLYNIPTHL